MSNLDNDKQNIKISVIVASYNYEKYLKFEGISRRRSVERWLAHDPHYCERKGYAEDEAFYAEHHETLNSWKERYSLIIAEEKKNGRI